MNQLVKDKVFMVKVVDKENYVSVVELVDASVTPVVKISRHLIQEGCAAEESGMMFPAVGGSDVKQTNGEYEHVLLNWHFLTSYYSGYQECKFCTGKNFPAWLMESNLRSSEVQRWQLCYEEIVRSLVCL